MKGEIKIMDKILCLMYTGNYFFLTEKEIKKNLKAIQYILFPVRGIEVNAYIPIIIKPIEKIFRKILNFSKIDIMYSLCIVTSDPEFNYATKTDIQKQKVTLYSLVDLYNILNSLDRLDYVNSIANTEDCLLYSDYDIMDFQIYIYDDKGEIIYDKQVEKKVVEISNRAYIQILKELRDIYPIYAELGSHPWKREFRFVMDIKNKIWIDVSEVDMKSIHLDDKMIYGYSNYSTMSVIFLDKEAYADFIKMEAFGFDLIIDIDGIASNILYVAVSNEEAIHLVSYFSYVMKSIIRLCKNDSDQGRMDEGTTSISLHISVEAKDGSRMQKEIENFHSQKKMFEIVHSLMGVMRYVNSE